MWYPHCPVGRYCKVITKLFCGSSNSNVVVYDGNVNVFTIWTFAIADASQCSVDIPIGRFKCCHQNSQSAVNRSNLRRRNIARSWTLLNSNFASHKAKSWKSSSNYHRGLQNVICEGSMYSMRMQFEPYKHWNTENKICDHPPRNQCQFTPGSFSYYVISRMYMS